MASSPRIITQLGARQTLELRRKAHLPVHRPSACSGVKALRNTSDAKAASRQAPLAFRSLDPFRALREPDRRRRDEKRPFPLRTKNCQHNPKQPLDRKSPIQVCERAHPKRHVNTGCYQVDTSGLQDQIDLDSRILGEERRQPRNYLKPRERHRRRNPQSARERRCGAARGEFCFLGFFDRPFGAVVQISARLGWCQAVRRP